MRKRHFKETSQKILLLECLLASKILTNNFASAQLDVYQFLFEKVQLQVEVILIIKIKSCKNLLIKSSLKFIFIPLLSINNSGKLSETCIRSCSEKALFTDLRTYLKTRLNRICAWTFNITQYIHKNFKIYRIVR